MKSLNRTYSRLTMRRRYEAWFLRFGLADGSGAWWFRYLLTNLGRSGCPGIAGAAPAQVWATWFPRDGRPEIFIQEFPLQALILDAPAPGGARSGSSSPFSLELGQTALTRTDAAARSKFAGRRSAGISAIVRISESRSAIKDGSAFHARRIPTACSAARSVLATAYFVASRSASACRGTTAAFGTAITGRGCTPAFRNRMAASARSKHWSMRCRSGFAFGKRFSGTRVGRIYSESFANRAATARECSGTLGNVLGWNNRGGCRGRRNFAASTALYQDGLLGHI